MRHVRYVPRPQFRRADELTVREMCQRFGVRLFVVYYWIEHGVVPARREKRWISVADWPEFREGSGAEALGRAIATT